MAGEQGGIAQPQIQIVGLSEIFRLFRELADVGLTPSSFDRLRFRAPWVRASLSRLHNTCSFSLLSGRDR